MQNFNHVAGGFAFTGIFASFAEVNIFERFDTMAVVWIAAVLPDIDHTKSIIGKTCYPVAKWLQTRYGHRTITHSLWFFVAVVALSKGFDNLFHQHFTLPVALALGSHLIFDMCTKEGIPIFYPFSRRSAVLPANRNLRLSTNDFRSEAILFGVFCCLNVFSYPLMAAGFWSKYNKSFATWDHFEREVKRKPGDYEARFLIGESDTVTAIIVEQKASELITWRKENGEFRFVRYDPARCRLIDFRRLATRHHLQTINLLRVSVDSLNRYMKQPVVKITVQSEQPVYYFEGAIMKKGNELTADYPNGPHFEQVAIDNAQTGLELRQLDLEYKAALARNGVKLAELAQYRADLSDHTRRSGLSDYEEGKRRDLIRELKAKIDTYVLPEPVDGELYRVHKQMLEHRLQQTAYLNATLLLWQVQSGRN